MKKSKLFIPILMIAIIFNVAFLFLFNCNRNEAKAYVLNQYDLVDSGKHMDWTGSTTYSEAWSAGVQTWNNEHNVIRQDTWKTVIDVTICDYNSSTGTYGGYVAYCYPSQKTINFNSYYMENLSTVQRQNVMTHELGHALGIDHNTDSNSIMYPYVSTVTSLSQDDINAYTWLYNNHY